MKEFTIPLLSIRLEKDTDSKMESKEVDGIELEYCWADYAPRRLFTGVFMAGGTDGLALSWCAEAPRVKNAGWLFADTSTNRHLQGQSVAKGFAAKRRPYKGLVFLDDCLEVFVQPEGSDFYYGWEINAAGSCLDYRVGCTAAGIAEINTNPSTPVDVPLLSANADGADSAAFDNERKTGLFEETIAGSSLLFDYNWCSKAQWRWQVEDEFWYMELFIPWSDFGLSSQPQPGSVWRGTINRIDEGSGAKNPGLQSLLEENDIPRYHQVEKFAEFKFLKQ